jgi:hypothetical protein
VNRLPTLAVLSALVALAVPITAAADPGPAAPDLAGRYAARADGTFVGTDGVTYPSAPQTVVGRKGDLYYGPDFDVACGIGSRVANSIRKIAQLARVIERSGRTVVWTLAPSKTSVLPRHLPGTPPHGRCDSKGLEAVRRAIDQQQDRNYLPLRQTLAAAPGQVYFKTDMHWTTVGGSVFARELARRLDPAVGRLQRYRHGTETRLGLLNWFRGVDEVETAETARPATRVQTRTARDSTEQWGGYPALTADYSWTSGPHSDTIPGRTLLVGDSFTMYALDNMLPIFRHGRFIWVDQGPERDLLRAIKNADTVVLEAPEVFTPLGGTPLTSVGFRRDVNRVLR